MNINKELLKVEARVRDAVKPYHYRLDRLTEARHAADEALCLAVKTNEIHQFWIDSNHQYTKNGTEAGFTNGFRVGVMFKPLEVWMWFYMIITLDDRKLMTTGYDGVEYKWEPDRWDSCTPFTQHLTDWPE